MQMETEKIITSKTKKIGRPKLNAEVKKICPVYVAFSPNDYIKVEEKSKLAGTNVTAFVRSSALSANIIARPSPERMEAIRRFNNLRNGIGNNLNQLAKKANAFGYSNEIHGELKNLLLNYDSKNY
jgi:hypothetical protein